MQPDLSLVVPFYNEKNILQNYRKLITFLGQNVPNYELIFVNDGSGKKYIRELKPAVQKDKHATLLNNTKNHGRGYAVKQGFNKAKGSYIAYIDSDLEISPEYLPKMMASFNNCDAVIASKFLPKSKIETSTLRKVSSIIYNFIVKLILQSKIKDHQAGLKVFKKDAVKSSICETEEHGWLFDVEFLYILQQKGFQIKEYPVKIRYGFGKIKKSFIIDFIKLPFTAYKIKTRHSNEK